MEQLIYLILLFPTFPQRDWPLLTETKGCSLCRVLKRLNVIQMD